MTSRGGTGLVDGRSAAPGGFRAARIDDGGEMGARDRLRGSAGFARGR